MRRSGDEGMEFMIVSGRKQVRMIDRVRRYFDWGAGRLPSLEGATLSELVLLRLEVGHYASVVYMRMPVRMLRELSSFMTMLSDRIDSLSTDYMTGT